MGRSVQSPTGIASFVSPEQKFSWIQVLEDLKAEEHVFKNDAMNGDEVRCFIQATATSSSLESSQGKDTYELEHRLP